MAAAKREKKAFLPPNMEVLVVPLALFIVLIILFFIVGRIGISRISSQRQKLTTARNNEIILEQKQEVLQDLKGEVLSMADQTAVAIPDKNPALAVISQIKGLTASKLIALSSLKVGSKIGDGKGLSKVEIGFEVEGDFPQIMDFLQDLEKFAPLSIIEAVKISQMGGVTRATTTLVSFWAPYPTKLPALTEPLTSLSADEKDLFSQLSGLVPPPFVEITPSLPSERADPFGF